MINLYHLFFKTATEIINYKLATQPTKASDLVTIVSLDQ